MFMLHFIYTPKELDIVCAFFATFLSDKKVDNFSIMCRNWENVVVSVYNQINIIKIICT